MANPNGCLETLTQLKSVHPPLWLRQSPQLSQQARSASQQLFSSLQPFCPKSPFDTLLVENFDAEQIWQQIDLQTTPLILSLKRELKRLEKNPGEISKLFGERIGKKVVVEEKREDLGEDYEGSDDSDEDGKRYEEEDEEEEENGGEDEEEDYSDDCGIEDKFLKIKEMSKFMEDDEEREYGDWKVKNEAEAEDEDKDDEVGGFGEDDDDEDGADIRYEDFYEKEQEKGPLSTHEKYLQKNRYDIEQMEKANMGPKDWPMEGEVTAGKRPKNSALEVDIDFEHNVNPPPQLTESDNEKLNDTIRKHIEIKEDLMKKRLEGRFDHVDRAPKETKELDESKSKKGLTEIYEESVQKKTGFVPNAEEDKLEKEISTRMKELQFLLSQFSYKPKPIIEDMSIQTNVPALAMEEIAPVAVSDAAMLAPEEVFAGKGDIKEEVELTREERKQRRANKKRKFKATATKKMGSTPLDFTMLNPSDGKEDS